MDAGGILNFYLLSVSENNGALNNYATLTNKAASNLFEAVISGNARVSGLNAEFAAHCTLNSKNSVMDMAQYMH